MPARRSLADAAPDPTSAARAAAFVGTPAPLPAPARAVGRPRGRRLEPLGVRVPPELAALLRSACKASRRELGATVAAAIENALPALLATLRPTRRVAALEDAAEELAEILDRIEAPLEEREQARRRLEELTQ
jgi:uncharacterized protein (DUF1778 family)